MKENRDKISENLPKLSKGTQKRMKAFGLDTKRLSNEQLEALGSIDKPEKQHWFIKIFTFGAVLLGIGAVALLLKGDFITFIIAGFVAICLMYIGYRAQIRISAKKFIEASKRNEISK